MANPIITLTTDYGTNDHLVAAVKGVILGILPTATIVDICHHVMPFDILDGALTIGSAYACFPPRTVHVVVVDPGVGTERRPILVSAGQHYFVAPDNGVLSMVYQREENVLGAPHHRRASIFCNPVSSTFHGRDVFAPAAAWLAKAYQSEAFGEAITDYAQFSLPRVRADGAAMKGVVLRVDAFGNVLTNFTLEDLPRPRTGRQRSSWKWAGSRWTNMVRTFAQGAPGEPWR